MTTRTRILVTGSRDFTNQELATQALLAVVELRDFVQNPVLVHGAARGLDTTAAAAATELGWATEAHPAKWDEHGGCWCKDMSRRCGFAGLRRNGEMIALGADLVVAFPLHPLHPVNPANPQQSGSRGTWQCAEAAKEAGLPIFVLWRENLYPFGDRALELTPGPVNIITGGIATLG